MKFNNNLKNKMDIKLVDRKKLDNIFYHTIRGYHIVNEEELKEHKWEEVNRCIFKVYGIKGIQNESKGKHTVGMDFQVNNTSISNKTGKITKGNLSISSYRLTSLCDCKNPNKINNITKGILEKDKNVNFYSILARENKNGFIYYYWYYIPVSCKYFSANSYAWKEKKGTVGKNKGKQIGWESKYMKIIFSMSSQLWFKIPVKKIEKYKICETKVKPKNLLSYYELSNNIN